MTAISERLETSFTQVATVLLIQSSIKFGDPIAAPRCLSPRDITVIVVPAYTFVASSKKLGFTTILVFSCIQEVTLLLAFID